MIEPPIDDGAEHDTAAWKAALSMFPVVGGPLAELYGLFFDQVDRRRKAWIIQVSAAINQLQSEHRVSLDVLQRNEAFASFVLQASGVALQNHRVEKLNALRNAIVSIGQSQHADEDLAFQFLRYIEVLTVTHVAILSTIWNRHEEMFEQCKTLGELYQQLKLSGFSELDREVARAFLKDLQAMNLLSLVDLGDYDEFKANTFVLLHSDATNSSPPVVTALGQNFLRFIGQGSSQAQS
jgi:hypothetical protein